MPYKFVGRELNLVTDFGAPDWTKGDASPALKAAHDAISDYAPGPYPTLVIPQGHYRFYQPSLCQWEIPNLIRGEGKQSTILEFVNGPFTVAPSLSEFRPKMGSDAEGSFYILSGEASQGLQSQSFNLGIDRDFWVDGLAQLSIMTFVKFTNFRGGPQTILSSMGRKLSTDPITSAFSIATQQSSNGPHGALQAHMQIGGASIDLAGGSLITGQMYLIALTYDGAKVSLFLGTPGQPMQRIASKAASGAVTQPYSETVSLGYSFEDWPMATTLHNQADAHVYQVAITDKAEFSAGGFTTPKPVWAGPLRGKSLCPLNASPPSGIFIPTADHQWIPARYLLKVFTYGVVGFGIRDLAINNMLWMYVQNSRADNLQFVGAGTRQFECWNNCFNNSGANLDFIGGSRFGFLASIAAGPWNFAGKIFVQGGIVPFVLANGSMIAQELEIVPTSNTIDAALFKGISGDSFIKAMINIDAESGEGSVIIDDIEQFDIGGAMQALTKPPLIINGGSGGVITAPNFKSSHPIMIRIGKLPSNPVRIIGGLVPRGAQLADNMRALSL